MSSWVQREFSAAGSCWIHSIGKKKPQKPCSTHSCLKSMQRHAPLVCLWALLMPPPRAVHVCTACRCCKQHLASWFLHLQCCTCEDAIKNSITISKSNSHSKCISILPSALLHELLQVDAESLHLYFMGICSPQYSVDCRDVKKNAQTAPGRSYFYVVRATLCRWESNPHNPKCHLHPMPELETLQQKQCSFSSTGRAAL